MALATQCPHCNTTFRVASDQLKLRGGIVRCGACHEIFDGNASLVDLSKAPADAPVTAPTAAPAAAPAVGALEEIPVYTLDLGHALDPLGIMPKPEDVQAPESLSDALAAEPVGGLMPEPLADTPVAGPVAEPSAEPLADALVAEPVAEPSADPLANASVTEPFAEPLAEPLADALVAEPFAALSAVPPADEPAPEPLTAMRAHDGRIEPTLHDENNKTVVAPLPDIDAEVQRAPSDYSDANSETVVAPLPDIDAEARAKSADADANQETVVAPLPNLDAEAPRAAFAQAAADRTPLPQRRASADVGSVAAPPMEAPKSARARQQARRSKLTPTKIEPPRLRVPEIDEPEFVKRGRQREQSGRRRLILWAGGSALLLLMLLAQAAIVFRNDLAVRAPALRPALASACSLLRCRVELPARIDNLTIETGELQTLAPDTYMLTTLLHNQASVAQAWPDIELALTDANDKPLVRRVFAPADYLPKDAAAAGFAPRAEQPVKLYFQLDQLKPSGYHTVVFYP